MSSRFQCCILVYFFMPLFLASCITPLKVVREESKTEPGNFTISSEGFIVKEPAPFNLSEVSLKFIYANKSGEAKYLFNIYYFGPKREDITKLALRIDSEDYEYISQIPVKLEEHGMLGFSEKIYIEIPEGTLNKILESGNCELKIFGNHSNFKKVFDSATKSKLKYFLKVTTEAN